MPDSSATAPLPDDLTFEQAMQRLEALVETLETDDASLEAALAAYEEGVQLTRFCMERLNTAELRVQQLGLEDDG